MCTCIAMKTRDVYFGRTLDLQYRFGEKVAVTPRNYPFTLRSGETFDTWYAMVGMARVEQDYPLYAEATNEKGLSMAGLYFPGNAVYGPPVPGKRNLATYELIPWAMGNFASLEDLRRELEQVHLTNEPFSRTAGASPLHWMASDGTNSLVVEQTASGLHLYDNPAGVLTNNPEFPYHTTHLNSYLNLTSRPPQNRFSRGLDLKAFGNGMGAIGLPGDDSPPSRFVRACFTKWNSQCGSDDASSVAQFFHILESVSIVRGAALMEDNQCNVTNYACCVNATRGVYYYKTYSNNQLTAVRMTDANKNGSELAVYELEERQQVRFMN